jgi:ribosome-binding protein aMBF1 (putative translation factor)
MNRGVITMTSIIDKIVSETGSEQSDAIREVANKVLLEVLNILQNEQGSMNKRADIAKQLADEIKWKLTTNFDEEVE